MNRRTIKITQVAAAILSLWLSVPCAPLTAQTKDTGTLTVRVTGARNTKGKIGVTLFQDAQGFPDDPSKAVRQQSVDIDPDTMSAQVAFKDLPQGTFAVSVLHDENGNGKMDKNFVGMAQRGLRRFQQPQEEKARTNVRRSEILFEQFGTGHRDHADLLTAGRASPSRGQLYIRIREAKT